MPLIFWIFWLTFIIVLYPHLFVFRSYESRPLGGENYQAFQFFESIWLFLSIGGLVWGMKSSHDYSTTFALTTMCFASISIPAALFSGLTGRYPERTQGGYRYYVYKKNPAKRLLAEMKYPELKTIGWIQTALLIIIIFFALRMI